MTLTPAQAFYLRSACGYTYADQRTIKALIRKGLLERRGGEVVLTEAGRSAKEALGVTVIYRSMLS